MTATETTIDVGGSTVELDGHFAGNGAFILSTRAARRRAPYRGELRQYMPPNLAEGRTSTRPDQRRRRQAFLTGDGEVRFTVELRSAVSAFDNTLGVYKVEADGKISDVHVLFANTLNVAAGARTVDLGAPGNGEHIGFFLIQDGFNKLRRPAGQPRLPNAGHDQAANVEAALPMLISATSGALERRPGLPFLRRAQPTAADQVLSGVTPGGHELQIGFEDLPTRQRRQGFQDVVVGVHATGDGFLLHLKGSRPRRVGRARLSA